jgi:RecB family endonuclease NucS
MKLANSFYLNANCQVIYRGRARSTLEQGDYVIIRKQDGTLLVHGSAGYRPLNYQPPGGDIKMEDSKIISVRKGEVIEITINTIYNYFEIPKWDDNDIVLTGSESDLIDKFLKNPEDYVDIDIKEITREYKTIVGPIDLVLIDTSDVYHVFEFKRNKANIDACTQLLRYTSHLSEGHECLAYLACPDISKNAEKYLDNKGKYICIDF